MTAVYGLSTRPFADSTDSLLRFAMRLDATLTGFAGLFIAAAADPGVMDVSTTWMSYIPAEFIAMR